ncbi:MAG: hypothetical protein KGJ79_12675 [Alphaproteobacteria bacterium]|nr:hypothetical protein [Alphaproteobacteria bacterium]MDE2493690.1 hypothetical protein [Alphaproteobacteria bacterium]
MSMRNYIVGFAVTIAAMWLTSSSAYALASFSRQTGVPCSSCHTSFPETTAFGRAFKLNGYTTSNDSLLLKQEDTDRSPGLGLLQVFPMSVSVRTSLVSTSRSVPGSQDPSTEFPQQLNIWLAGQITPHIGTYIQLTYSENGDHLGLDNSDVRYVGTETTLGGESLIWGIDANNDPTFEDLWNSTPGYGFPFATPDSAGFMPGPSTMIDGTLGHHVIGIGPYAMWANHLYGLVEVYRSENIGEPQPETGTGAGDINVQAVAPYWRFAWQENLGRYSYFEIGTYGIYLKTYPGAISGPTDRYVDVAGDMTYELTLPNSDLFVLHSTYIHESTQLSASFAAGSVSQTSDDLNTFRADASYHFGNKLSFTAGTFFTWGTRDILRYPTGALTGYSNGSPDNGGYVLQAAYWPWQNLELGVQYRGFTKFNGANSNYDGAGRNAADNNTFYAFVWLNV